MILEQWQIDLISVRNVGEVKAFCHVYEFIKNNQRMSGQDFKDTYNAITDIMEQHCVNYGVLILVSGFLVFTEVPLDLNALMIKLSTGINFEGQISDAKGLLDTVNTHLAREKTK